MASLNEDIRDELVVHDVRNLRVIAGVQRQVDARLARLQQQLRRVVLEVDPTGTPRRPNQEKRMRRAEKEANELIRTAFADVERITNEAVRRMSRTEVEALAKAIESQVGKLLG